MGVGAGLYMYDVVVKTLTFAISSTDDFLSILRIFDAYVQDEYNSIEIICFETISEFDRQTDVFLKVHIGLCICVACVTRY